MNQRYRSEVDYVLDLQRSPNEQAIGIWSPYIEQGDISISKTRKRDGKTSQTWLRSTDLLMTIKHVIPAKYVSDCQRFVYFGLCPKKHGMDKRFQIKIAHLVRFFEDDEGTHIVLKKIRGLRMFHGHDFLGHWQDPADWGQDDSHDYLQPTYNKEVIK